MMKNIVRKIIIAACIITLAACASKKNEKQEETPPANKVFALGENYLEKGQFKKAKESFIIISQEYPYSKEAQKAQYLEGFANYKLKSYDEAVIALDEYVELYPAGDDIENAYYLRALCYYDQILEVRLDQEVAEKALEALNDLVVRFPGGVYEQDANLKIDLVNDQLAGKELSIGRFYLKKGIISGAINRFQNVVKNYPTTSYIEEALYRLVESYMILGVDKEAQIYASILGKNYPSSSWYHKSYNLLNKK